MIDFTIATQQFEMFLLVLVRIASFVFVAPFFATSNTPQRLKIGFSLCLTFLVFPLVQDATYSYSSVVDYAALVFKESIAGLMLGFVSSMVVQIVQMAGHIIDMDMGLSMATVYNPQTRTQDGIMGNFYYYILMLMLIVTGLHRFMIQAIVETFTVVPLGNVTFNGGLFDTMLRFMTDYIVLGFRIALPIFCTTLITNCVLAIMAKIAPQMNMFVIGVQLKILGGIAVLMAIIYVFPGVCNAINNEITRMMQGIVGGLM